MAPTTTRGEVADDGGASAGSAPHYLGVDVGGTNIKIGLVDANGKTLAATTLLTECKLGPEHACWRIGQEARRLVASIGGQLELVARVGLAVPGSIDSATGMLVSPANLPGWWNFPLRVRASHHLGRPVTLANDANAAAFGEHWCGAGACYQNMILLTLGTGIGGGIIVGGGLLEGSHNCASECGYIVIDLSDDARTDALGKRGTLEAYTSARAVVERTCDALSAGEISSLSIPWARCDPITPQIIAAEAELGDRLARRIVLDTARYLAIGIVTLIHAIDPDAVVIGGAMTFGGATSALGRDFLQRIRADVRARLLEPLQDKIQIEFASLGGDAGYIGAAGLARCEHALSQPSIERPLQFVEPLGGLSSLSCTGA